MKNALYDNIPEADYHDAPACSASMIIDIDDIGPARSWYKSPLNPAYEQERKRAFDIGKALHLVFLEPERLLDQVAVINAFTKDGKPSETYATADSKAQRDAAYAAGKIPLLPAEWALINDMRRAARNEFGDLPFDTAPAWMADLFTGGRNEVTMFWRHPEFGFACRGRIDCLRLGDGTPETPDKLIDYKSMGRLATEMDRTANERRWHRRAAHYIDGYTAVTGRVAEYWFVGQEKTPPHIVTAGMLPNYFLDDGRAANRRAYATYLRCISTGRWPTGSETPITIHPPAWAQKQIEDRHQHGHWKIGKEEMAELKAMAIAMQAPAGR